MKEDYLLFRKEAVIPGCQKSKETLCYNHAGKSTMGRIMREVMSEGVYRCEEPLLPDLGFCK